MNECGTLLFSCTSWGSLILKYQSTLAARSGARNIIICRNAKKIQISVFFREHFLVKEIDEFFFEYFNFRNEIFKLISLIGRHVLKLTSSTRVGYILELKRCWGLCLWNFSYICF